MKEKTQQPHFGTTLTINVHSEHLCSRSRSDPGLIYYVRGYFLQTYVFLCGLAFGPFANRVFGSLKTGAFGKLLPG